MDRRASTVQPPFSGKLKVDKRLKMSHDDFKELIQTFHENRQLSSIDQLKASPPYPTPHVLAQFASMAYRDCNREYPEPPDGWQLLTTASNSRIKNGYFGIAYWHPQNQQVVIAHRGTEIKITGAFGKSLKSAIADVYTDIKGVLFNNYVPQMNSASTFANKVVAVLQEIHQQRNVHFELFFTGHSLGGWLAQITSLTTEHLEEKEVEREQDAPLESGTMQDRHDDRQRYHPHTVAFESPGCAPMLSKLESNFDVRHYGSSIHLQHLDITSYLSAPNLINTCNPHLGTVYRIFTDLSDMGYFVKHTALYNLATHKIHKIVQAFDPETGQVRKDDKGELKIREVVDWPVSEGLTGGAELNNFFEWANQHNDYHPEVLETVPSNVPEGHHPLHYKTKAYEECANKLSVFSKDEREFVKLYPLLRNMLKLLKLSDCFSVMSNREAQNEAERKLQNFELEYEKIRCPEANILHALIPYVKRLIQFFPHIKAKFSLPEIINRAYQYETRHYVEKIHQSSLDFNPSALGLKEFLDSDQQIWHLRMIDGDAWTGITKVYRVLRKTFCKPNYSSEGHYTILKVKQLLTDNRMINLKALLASMATPHLLMIACGTNQPVNDELRDMVRELFSILIQKTTIKIILTMQSECSTADLIQQIAREVLGEGFNTTDV